MHKEKVMKSIFTKLAILTMAGAMVSLSGCGGGGSPSSTAVATVTPVDNPKNAYAVLEDTYGIQNATFLTSSRSGSTLTLRSAIAASVTDPAFKTLYRIDFTDAAGTVKGTYSVGSAVAGLPQFPGSLYIFNGHNATMLQVVSGTISFDSFGANAGDLVAGTLSVVFADNNAAGNVKPTYSFRSSFGFVVNSSEQILPAPEPVPAQAASLYAGKCSACHLLGSVDTTAGGAPDLSLKGGELETVFAPGHKNVALAPEELRSLKVLFNAN